MRTGRFKAADLEALDRAKILGVRSGTEHEHTRLRLASDARIGEDVIRLTYVPA